MQVGIDLRHVVDAVRWRCDLLGILVDALASAGFDRYVTIAGSEHDGFRCAGVGEWKRYG